MRLHYLAGEAAAALLAFDRCEQVLKDEVGIAPSAETLALLRTIVSAEAVAADERAAPALRAVPAAVLRPPRRIGRADVWEMLRREGEPRVRVVVGEAGMGKSRLLVDLVQLQAPPRRVLAAARPGDSQAPYALATRVLRGVIAAVGIS